MLGQTNWRKVLGLPKRPPRRTTPLLVDPLEARMLLSLTTQLVADINTAPVVSVRVSGSIVEMGGLAYFAGNDGASLELFKSDGTATGTRIVKEIPGGFGSYPTNLTNVSGTLFFTANYGSNTATLWKSDGTAAGTVLVRDIQPGTNIYFPFRNLTNVNGTLFFIANDGVSGYGIWKSDGTAAGTVLVKAFAGAFGSNPGEITELNGQLFFSANDGTSGFELWKSDGTAGGTVLVKDIAPGTFITPLPGVPPMPLSSQPKYLSNVNGTLFFAADDGTSGRELWKSDGTAGGTILIKDILPGTLPFPPPGAPSGGLSSAPRSLTNVNGKLFFVANDGSSGYELWKSDGSADGTVLVKDIEAGPMIGSNPVQLTNINGVLYFAATDSAHGTEVWKSDGMLDGTVLVKDRVPGAGGFVVHHIENVNGKVFFAAADAATASYELWKSDGTEAGTVLVMGVQASESGFGGSMLNVNGLLFCQAKIGTTDLELWKSDGSTAGTMPITSRRTSPSSPGSFETVDGIAFFIANDGVHGYELWKTDGTAGGTMLVKDIADGAASSSLKYLTNVAGKLFFSANDRAHGTELWTSDGTADGTVLVKDISVPPLGNPNSFNYSSNPSHLINLNGTLLFSAFSSSVAAGLWKSNGTAGDTVLVKDLGIGGGSAYQFTNVNGKLFFNANDGNGAEPWTSDGTAAGTVMVKDLAPGTHTECTYFPPFPPSCGPVANSSYPRYFTNVNGTIYFATAIDTYELWKTDGTADGTVLVKNLPSGAYPSSFTNVNGTLFFTARKASFQRNVWRSDGTDLGTVQVAASIAAHDLTVVGSTLFFFDDTKLWKVEGTAAPVLVKDFGGLGTHYSSPVTIGGTLFFDAGDGINGDELWKSDGTASRTLLMTDLAPGSASSFPSDLRAFAGGLYFSADDSLHGRELFVMREDNIPNTAPSFANGGDDSWTDEKGFRNIAWTIPSPGPTEEAAQAVVFTVTSDNAALFAFQPSIDRSGKLTYKPAPNATGTATVTVVLIDSGGTANGGVDSSFPQTFLIHIIKPHIWHSTKLWRNSTPGLDVNLDNHVAANDALAVINYINAFGNVDSGHVPALGSIIAGQSVTYGGPFGYLDVNGDDNIAPNDALAIVNVINAAQGGEGELPNPDIDLMTLLAIDVASRPKRR